MSRRLQMWTLILAVSFLAGCATRSPPYAGPPSLSKAPPLVAPHEPPKTPGTGQNRPGAQDFREIERGQASWYGPRFHGRRTANGERYDQHAMTAAHKTLPFGSLVRVRSLVNGKEVDVRINDRGPFGRGRVIDVSRAAAEALGMLDLGIKPVVLLAP